MSNSLFSKSSEMAHSSLSNVAQENQNSGNRLPDRQQARLLEILSNGNFLAFRFNYDITFGTEFFILLDAPELSNEFTLIREIWDEFQCVWKYELKFRSPGYEGSGPAHDRFDYLCEFGD
jgi:hypothetical protein